MQSISVLKLPGTTSVVGLAKNEEELFFAGDSASLKLPYTSESLKFIRRGRDEVHRFGIAFHRQKRSKGTFKNELEDIPGIGKTIAGLLLKEFRSVNNIRETIRQGKGAIEIGKIIGISKAKLVVSYFMNDTEGGTKKMGPE